MSEEDFVRLLIRHAVTIVLHNDLFESTHGIKRDSHRDRRGFSAQRVPDQLGDDVDRGGDAPCRTSVPQARYDLLMPPERS